MSRSTAARGRRSKWGNVPTDLNGVRFASKAEARRWVELNLLVRAGEIRPDSLTRQMKIPLSVRGTFDEPTVIGHYVADFHYTRHADGQRVIEDVKGGAKVDPLYAWKKKHVKAQYGITIQEIRYGRRR